MLITGFGAFPGARFNPTAELVLRLARRRPRLANMRIVSHVLPVTMEGVPPMLKQLFEKHQPDIILMFGLAARTPYLRIETRARNARSVLFPDAAGARGLMMSLSVDAPREIRSRAPHRVLLRAMQEAGVPTRLSRDAGRYVCNFAYWHALSDIRDGRKTPLVQFVHVPRIVPPASRRHRRPQAVTMHDLVRAGEAVLLALATAARRWSPVGNEKER